MLLLVLALSFIHFRLQSIAALQLLFNLSRGCALFCNPLGTLIRQVLLSLLSLRQLLFQLRSFAEQIGNACFDIGGLSACAREIGTESIQLRLTRDHAGGGVSLGPLAMPPRAKPMSVRRDYRVAGFQAGAHPRRLLKVIGDLDPRHPMQDAGGPPDSGSQGARCFSGRLNGIIQQERPGRQ